ncbi:hypothetical protein [Salinithrix halophila]|uniref:Uncharacterized protein n=1 Tax=Salinithrix halophila TaxID=1485204 RepID=A0ABV8JEK6_9BACL
MSEEKPLQVLRVSDFHTSLTFYRDKLGFEAERIDLEAGAALLVAPGGSLLLVTENPDLDAAAYLAETTVPAQLFTHREEPEGGDNPALQEEDAPSELLEEDGEPVSQPVQAADETFAEEKEPGEREETPAPRIVEVGREDRLEFPGENLLFHQERLAALGIRDMLLEEYPAVEQILLLKDPDEYQVAFHESLRLSDEELLSLYTKGPDLLEGAILGMLDEDLDLPVEEGGETIRRIILQLVDFDLEMTQRIKWALAEPGHSYPLPLYDPDQWAESLRYESRPIHVEVGMLRLLRDHILILCEQIPDALDRHLVSERGTVEVRTMLQVVAETSREQIQTVLDVRHQYGK